MEPQATAATVVIHDHLLYVAESQEPFVLVRTLAGNKHRPTEKFVTHEAILATIIPGNLYIVEANSSQLDLLRNPRRPSLPCQGRLVWYVVGSDLQYALLYTSVRKKYSLARHAGDHVTADKRLTATQSFLSCPV
jgi:hypothetical protein